MNESYIKIGMNKKQFEDWKREWNLRIPECSDFSCVHECSSCAIDVLCSQGSIWNTYSKQKHPQECLNVSCADCVNRWDCKLTSKEERGIYETNKCL